MNYSKDAIKVGRIALPYSHEKRGWVTSSGYVTPNPFKAQRVAELINEALSRRSVSR